MKRMDYKKVNSSNVDSVAHDAENNVLGVRYKQKDGGVAEYHYPGVGAAKHAELMRAESIGSHLSKHIKPNFKAIKV
jgi:hypothetical protein